MARTILLASAVGVVGVIVNLTPFILALDENAGLDWLFMLRGPIDPPSEVIVIGIDRRSADKLTLSNDLEDWPRELHAELVARLSDAGASVIAFDILFKETRNPEQDRQFADAVASAGNVVLFQYIRKTTQPLENASSSARELITEQLISPFAPLADAAVGLGPFPLPVFPIKVSQFWAFKAGMGDAPTLPIVTLQVYALDRYVEFVNLLRETSNEAATGLPASSTELIEAGPVQGTVSALRRLFATDRELGPAMLTRLERNRAENKPATSIGILSALIRIYQGADSYFLNFYGPPRTIRTVAYTDALSTSPPLLDLDGKAVFVGFSEALQPEQRDTFYSVFSGRSGLNLSGVEIAATAFANLLDGTSVKPLSIPVHLLVVFLWGVMIAMVLDMVSTRVGIIVAIAAGPAWVVFASWRFENLMIWMPLIVPLFVQLPLALFGALLCKYMQAKADRERIQVVFGYYLPADVVERMAEDLAEVQPSSQLVNGACLVTDAEQYTTLAEAMPPEKLASLMNDYYRVLFRQVDAHGGFVSDIVGDSMMAIWAAPTQEHASRENACRAALAMQIAVDEFNQSRDTRALPTRIGLDSGQIMLGNIGAESHFEYRAVGDIVNTASRIQGLNKRLGTSTLASGATLSDIPNIPSRALGIFRLAGKENPIDVHELLTESTNARLELAEMFVEALARFESQEWSDALKRFLKITAQFSHDGPSHFYADLCRRYLAEGPPAGWDGAVRVVEK